MKNIDVQTTAHDQFVNITDRVQQAVHDLGITDGTVTVFVAHTTCAVTINENEDPARMVRETVRRWLKFAGIAVAIGVVVYLVG